MASEDFVSFSIMRYLRDSGWYIIQYHPPGGQACFALKVLGEIVYPDLIAYREGVILIMENKGRFALADINKLRRMISDDDCKEQVIILVKDYLLKNQVTIPQDFSFLWGHGYSGRVRPETYEDIHLFNVNDSGIISISRGI